MKLTSVLGVPVVLTVCVCSLSAADNVILFIGDGMGFDHVKAGRVLVNGSSAMPLQFEGLGYAAQSITVLPNGTVTDSATAGTALATGYQHPANGVISMGADGSIKTTILELARAKGFRTGIITTDDIGGATPGAFGAHEPDRTYLADIRFDYLLEDTGSAPHPASRPDLLLGGGYDDSVYPGLATGSGYNFLDTATELESGELPLVGLFGNAWAPMTAMAYRAPETTQPRLSEMVAKALSLLDNAQGFFLMVESANIDKLSHSNDENFVSELPELDVAVQTALAWRASHPTDNTLILVTADHETGALTVPDQSLIPGTVPSMTWGSGGHSARNVPVYATWPASLAGLTVDNTEVFFMLEDYLNISSGGQPPVITALTVLGITETSATVQWDTVEPATTALYAGGTPISDDFSRVTRHTVVCGGLTPDTQYQFTASSKDIAGNTGSAVVSFSTTAPDFNARVLAEPLAAIGVVSGTIAGVAAPDDGSTQLVTEAPSGAGSRVLVEYTLHTSASPGAIETLTLNGNVS
jgi:alkaline phosphatase